MNKFYLSTLMFLLLKLSVVQGQDFSLVKKDANFDVNLCDEHILEMEIINHNNRSFIWERREKIASADWTNWVSLRESNINSARYYNEYFFESNVNEDKIVQYRVKLKDSNPEQLSNVLEKLLSGIKEGDIAYSVQIPCKTGVDNVTLNASNYLGYITNWQVQSMYWNGSAYVTSVWGSFSTSSSPTVTYAMPVIGDADEWNSTYYNFRYITKNGSCAVISKMTNQILATTKDPDSQFYYNIISSKTGTDFIDQIGRKALSIKICDGDSVILTGNKKYGGSESSFYEWSTGERTRSITVKKSGEYNFYATWRQPGCERYPSETVVYVSVESNPKPVIQSTNGIINGSIACGFDYTGLHSSDASFYYWSNGETTKSITAAVGGTYFVEALYNNGCSRKSDAVIVKQKPTILTQNKSICSGQSVNLSLTSDEPASFSWSVVSKSSNISGVTNGEAGTESPINTFPTNTSSSSGSVIYRLIANANPCTSEKNITVTINPNPVLTILPTSPSICANTTGITLTASGASGYGWSPSVGLSATTGASVSANPTLTTTYSVIGTGLNGCSSTAQTTVTVTPKPVVTAPNKTICTGDPVNLVLTTDVSGATLSWVVQSKSSTISGISVGTTGNSNLINHVLTNSSTSNTGTVIYRITPTLNSCNGNYKDISITVRKKPVTPTISQTGSLCSGGVVTLTSSLGSSYLWSTGQTTRSIAISYAGYYKVEITNSDGCSVSSIWYYVEECSPDPCDPQVYQAGRVPDPPCDEKIKKAELLVTSSTVYPNPSDERVTLHLPAPAEYDIQVEMYSQFGQVIHSTKIKKGENKVELSTENLSGGMYLIKMQLWGSKTFNRKVLVVHGN